MLTGRAGVATMSTYQLFTHKLWRKMLTHTEERMEVTEKHFGQKMTPSTAKLPTIIYSIGFGLAILFIPPVTGFVRDILNGMTANGDVFSSGGVALLNILLMITVFVIAYKFDNLDYDKREAELRKRIDKEYSKWYFHTLIPFLESKYNITFNENSSNVFRDEGEWAKAENGKMIRVKLGGIKHEFEPFDEQIGSLFPRGGHTMAFTFSGDVWLSEALESREINYAPMTAVKR